jgi:hypothetical protein
MTLADHFVVRVLNRRPKNSSAGREQNLSDPIGRWFSKGTGPYYQDTRVRLRRLVTARDAKVSYGLGLIDWSVGHSQDPRVDPKDPHRTAAHTPYRTHPQHPQLAVLNKLNCMDDAAPLDPALFTRYHVDLHLHPRYGMPVLPEPEKLASSAEGRMVARGKDEEDAATLLKDRIRFTRGGLPVEAGGDGGGATESSIELVACICAATPVPSPSSPRRRPLSCPQGGRAAGGGARNNNTVRLLRPPTTTTDRPSDSEGTNPPTKASIIGGEVSVRDWF